MQLVSVAPKSVFLKIRTAAMLILLIVSSVGTACGYGLDDRVSITGTD
jgi:hypothetical protein